MPEPDKKPHYHGHRERLRQRFMATDGDGMPDYELLELLLALAIPRTDVKPVAKALIDTFGSLGEVLSAEPAALTKVKGIGDNAATALKVVRAAGLRLSHQQVANREVIGSWDKLLAYCKVAMGY